MNKYSVDIEDLMVDTGEWGKINIRFVRPEGNIDKLPVIFYIHGAGWVFGSAQTHDKLIENFRSARILSLSFQNIVDHLKRNIQQQLNKIMLCCNS